MSRNTLALFGGESYINGGKVLLSTKFPTVLVSTWLFDDMKKSTRKGSFLFKKLVRSLIPDHKTWAFNKGSEMQVNFEKEIGASFGKLNI